MQSPAFHSLTLPLRQQPHHSRLHTTSTRPSPPPSLRPPHRISLSASPPATTATTLQLFLNWFRGDFDNCYQVADEREADLPRRARHEHMHCRIQPLSNENLAPAGHIPVFATYYYNGNPDIVFRRRIYTLTEADDHSPASPVLDMRIYKMEYIHGLIVAGANSKFHTIDMGSLQDPALYDHLDGAQFRWRYVPHTHPASGMVANGPHFVGTMRDGGFTSKDNLRYEDELVLTKEDLWVAERVYNADGVLVGGNRDGVPHKLCRIRPNHELKWTLDLELPEIPLLE